MNPPHARPMADYRRAQRLREAIDAARLAVFLVAMFAVILAAVLLYGTPPA